MERVFCVLGGSIKSVGPKIFALRKRKYHINVECYFRKKNKLVSNILPIFNRKTETVFDF